MATILFFKFRRLWRIGSADYPIGIIAILWIITVVPALGDLPHVSNRFDGVSRASAIKQIDSLRRQTYNPNRDLRLEAFRAIAERHEILGHNDSALKYFQIIYLASRARGVLSHRSAYAALDYARILKRVGLYRQMIDILDDIPEDRLGLQDYELRLERLFMLISGSLCVGELVRAYETWEHASKILLEHPNKNYKPQLTYLRGQILGVVQYNEDICATFAKAEFQSREVEQIDPINRINYLLCVTGCKLYGVKPQERDSILQLAAGIANAQIDPSLQVDILEVQYRILVHERDMDAAYQTAIMMRDLTQKHHLIHLKGLSFMYMSRNDMLSHADKADLLDSAIVYFRISNNASCLRLALRERMLYHNKNKDLVIFTMAHKDEYVKLVEEWADQKANVEQAFLRHDLEMAKVEMQEQAKVSDRLWWTIVGLVAVIAGVLGLLLRARLKLTKSISRSNELMDLYNETVERVIVLQEEVVELRTNTIIAHQEIETAGLKQELEEVKSVSEMREMLLQEIETTLKASPVWSASFDKVKHSLDTDLADSKGWSNLMTLFEGQKPQFVKKLMKQAPDLSPLDQKICAFLVLDLNTRTIAQMLNITEASLLNRRSAIRKKLALNRTMDLQTYLQRL